MASTSSIREEIIQLSNSLTLAQSQLVQLAKRVEQQEQATEIWKSRYVDLEVAYKEALTSAKWLRSQNADLERRMASHRPEGNVIQGASQKLKHARKVIRDLLNERGDMNSPPSRSSIRQEDIDQALYEEFQRDDDSPSTDSDKTVRLAPAPPQASTSQHSQESQVEESMYVESENSVACPSSQASQISIQTSEEEPRRGKWRLQFKKPPGTSVLTEGPISPSTLENDLSMDDYMRFSIQSLAESSDISMRFQVLRLDSKQNVACLYDPIFIDTGKESYILDWGHRETNESMEKYIKGHKDIDPVFHTFTFPLKEGGWFYIGAQHWTVVDFDTIWPLEGKSRKAIIKKLFKRSQGEVSETEIERLLDCGELVQFCVELTAVGDTSVSHNFSREVLGYRTPPHRHERRVEGVKE